MRSVIYGHSSTIPANWVKMGPVDVQIKDLTDSLIKRDRKLTRAFYNPTCQKGQNFVVLLLLFVLLFLNRYDTRCYFNVRSKADMSQLNLPHGNDN